MSKFNTLKLTIRRKLSTLQSLIISWKPLELEHSRYSYIRKLHNNLLKEFFTLNLLLLFGLMSNKFLKTFITSSLEYPVWRYNSFLMIQVLQLRIQITINSQELKWVLNHLMRVLVVSNSWIRLWAQWHKRGFSRCF